jgi:hypothetical protein
MFVTPAGGVKEVVPATLNVCENCALPVVAKISVKVKATNMGYEIRIC